MNQIALEDIATVFMSQFAKDHPALFDKNDKGDNKLLKMNYQKRRKLVEKTLTNLEIDLVSN